MINPEISSAGDNDGCEDCAFGHYAGLFSFKIFHRMRLTASLGCEAKKRSVSVIFVCPSKRKTDKAVFRKAAMTCGRFPVLACEASSPSTLSRIQWTLFSIVQCPRGV